MMNTFSHVPPGFRFHPTDEELVDYYLRKKIASKRIDLDVIKDVDLYRIEPWDLQELCKIGTEEQNDWYFFSHKDKKYPTGTRTNRATKAGFWKATGRDKAIYSKHSLIGMRKTLVFYKGRAPNGQKSDWIMHEYRLETNENAAPQEEGWVVCRVFKKRMTSMRKDGEHESLCWYDDQVPFMPCYDSPRRLPQPYSSYPPHNYPNCKQELDHLHYNMPHHDAAFLQLPQLESPKLLPHSAHPTTLSCSSSMANPYGFDRGMSTSANGLQPSMALSSEDHVHQVRGNHQMNNISAFYGGSNEQELLDQVTDWRVLDKFVASQLSHEEATKEAGAAYSNEPNSLGTDEDLNSLLDESKRQDMVSGSASDSQIALWK